MSLSQNTTYHFRIVATNSSGTSYGSDRTFKTLAEPTPPQVSGIEPTSGPTAGGTSTTITGTNFTGATAVSFGVGTAATSFKVLTPTSITAVSPAGTGTVDVTVTTPEGTSTTSSADHFTYVPAGPAPTVTRVAPTNGIVGGGTSVTITGTGFTGATSVKFGALTATSFKVNSAKSITATSPAESAGDVDVTVTTPNGTSAISAKDHYKYVPSITGVSPSTGTTAGGTEVTVTGTGFAVGTSATTFKFGTAKARGVNCTSTTSCQAIAPPHAAGTVDVVATVNQAVSAKVTADRFVYS